MASTLKYQKVGVSFGFFLIEEREKSRGSPAFFAEREAFVARGLRAGARIAALLAFIPLHSLSPPLSFQGFLDPRAGHPQVVILRLLRYVVRLMWRMQ